MLNDLNNERVRYRCAVVMPCTGVMGSLRVSGGRREPRGRGTDPGAVHGCSETSTQTFHRVDPGQHLGKGMLSSDQVFIIYLLT